MNINLSTGTESALPLDWRPPHHSKMADDLKLAQKFYVVALVALVALAAPIRHIQNTHSE